ncbi:MAG: hypothetical protein RSC68_00055 [Acinetobacter sp.]
MELFKDLQGARDYIKEFKGEMTKSKVSEVRFKEVFSALLQAYRQGGSSDHAALYHSEMQSLIAFALERNTIPDNIEFMLQNLNDEAHKGDNKRYTAAGSVISRFSGAFDSDALHDFDPYHGCSVFDVSRALEVSRGYSVYLHSADGIRAITDKLRETCTEYHSSASAASKKDIISILYMLRSLTLISRSSHTSLMNDVKGNAGNLYQNIVNALIVSLSIKKAALADKPVKSSPTTVDYATGGYTASADKTHLF